MNQLVMLWYALETRSILLSAPPASTSLQMRVWLLFGMFEAKSQPNVKPSNFRDKKSDRFVIYYVRSSSPDPKDQCPTFSLKNGGVSCAIELKRPVGTHCHGAGAVVQEDRGDKQMARKKLYIASAVCLIFMIGEVIGKSQTSVLVRIFDKSAAALSDILKIVTVLG